MARTFDGVDDQIVYGSESAIDDVSGYTACILARITANVTAEKSVLSKFASDYTAGKLYISALGDGGGNNKVFTYIKTSMTDANAVSTAEVLVVNTWRVIVTTWVGTIGVTAPKIYACDLGGSIAEVSYASSHAGTGSVLSDAGASLRVGTRDPLDTYFGGGLAEAALWNRVLSADEIASLGRGFAPAFFPRGRVFYSPVPGRSSPEMNWAGTTHGTVSGAVYLEHPRVIYPSSNTGVKPSAAAASFSPAWACGSNVLLGVGIR